MPFSYFSRKSDDSILRRHRIRWLSSLFLVTILLAGCESIDAYPARPPMSIGEITIALRQAPQWVIAEQIRSRGLIAPATEDDFWLLRENGARRAVLDAVSEQSFELMDQERSSYSPTTVVIPSAPYYYDPNPYFGGYRRHPYFDGYRPYDSRPIRKGKDWRSREKVREPERKQQRERNWESDRRQKDQPSPNGGGHSSRNRPALNKMEGS